MTGFKPYRETQPPHRLHLHPGPPDTINWPPGDPPTGTPRNGKKVKHQRTVAPGPTAKLLSPPASQAQTDATPVDLSQQRGATPFPSPTPAALPSGLVDSSPALSPLLPTPATIVRQLFQVDSADDTIWDSAPAPSSPSPMATSSRHPSPRPTPTMGPSHHPGEGQVSSSSSTSSQAPTILVPATPNTTNPNASALPFPEPYDNELLRLRLQRTELTTQLRTTTARTNWLRTRNTIEQGERLAAEALTAQARADRAAARGELAGVKRDVRVAKKILLGLLVLIVGYAVWCWWNAEEMAYIRRRRAEQFGLS